MIYGLFVLIDEGLAAGQVTAWFVVGVIWGGAFPRINGQEVVRTKMVRRRTPDALRQVGEDGDARAGEL